MKVRGGKREAPPEPEQGGAPTGVGTRRPPAPTDTSAGGGPLAPPDGGDFPSLRDTLRSLAPELFEQGKKKDGYRRDAPPTLFTGEGETTASSVRPRTNPGAGVPAYRLRAEAKKEQAPIDPEELDAMEYEAEDELDLVEEESSSDDAARAAQDYYYDLVADQAENNMEAVLRDAQGRVHARGEDLWHERYRYDAGMRMNDDELLERSRAEANDRASAERAAEARRAADEAAARAESERRAAADEAARRLAEDRNRR